jgi:flagellar basal-body rod protein FlgB
MGNITYELLKKSLDAAALRQRVIAHNIANINTKGFKRSDVVFEEKLKEEIAKGRGTETASNLEPQVVKDESTSIREDGNNVDIDLEMANMAANDILYNTLITQLNVKLGVMRYVINEGRR